MSKIKHILAGILIASASASAAFGSMYTGASAGYLIDGEEMIFAAQVGYQFGEGQNVQYELELEIGYTEDSEWEVSGEIIPIMANAKIAFELADSLKGYAGFGLGSSRVKGSGWGVSISDNVFTYQLMVGLRYSLNESVSLNAGYRYIRLNDVFDIADIDDSIVEAGIRFSF